jgi:glycosyltransferase involved in cell wall biosynthesis
VRDPTDCRQSGANPAEGMVPAVAPAVDPSMVERVKASKTIRRGSFAKYCERPRIALIVHSFNRIANVENLASRLTCLGDHELIVCEDGSIDGSHEKWMTYLSRPNDFLIHSNDLHEIRVLDRAIRFTTAEIVCIVQDDDSIPAGTDWLDDALALFDSYPRLAISGGFMGFRSFHPDPVRAQPVWGPRPFEFVHHVNIGPYFLSRAAYDSLGGWDHSFSDVGEPGICFESELCLRAWLNGYEVGYSFVPFKGPAGHYSLDGGTMLFSGEQRRRNQLRNQRKIYAMYARHARRIEALVARANRRAGVGVDQASSTSNRR